MSVLLRLDSMWVITGDTVRLTDNVPYMPCVAPCRNPDLT